MHLNKESFKVLKMKIKRKIISMCKCQAHYIEELDIDENEIDHPNENIEEQ